MSRRQQSLTDVWLERRPDESNGAVWLATTDPDGLDRRQLPVLQRLSANIFRSRIETASVSIVETQAADAGPEGERADNPMLPLCFVGDQVRDLIGLDTAHHGYCSGSDFRALMRRASIKGLHHRWHPGTCLAPQSQTDPAAPDPIIDTPASHPGRLVVAIDAAWLSGGESGAQVFAFEMIKELASREEIERVLMVSATGQVPVALRGVRRVTGMSWDEALRETQPVADILHRPYQPGHDVDYRRYRRVGRAVVVTVLDFIAYDIREYHESEWWWRRYRTVFDEHVGLADGVCAISNDVAERLRRQYRAAGLRGVWSIPLGTDHAAWLPDAQPPAQLPVDRLGDGGFLLVLGNDFEHKNRDFAVKVFAESRRRGYSGSLVLAGFHLDAGSSFGHELAGAGAYRGDVHRIGSVGGPEKAWLLRNADVVLYPTSAEGFGLIPFEAAACTTPTAFVRFGPLRDTLHDVEACHAWHVDAFADLVGRLLAEPGEQLRQIAQAGASLTWTRHVDRLIACYREVLSGAARRRRGLPAWPVRVARSIDRAVNGTAMRFRRLAGRPPR